MRNIFLTFEYNEAEMSQSEIESIEALEYDCGKVDYIEIDQFKGHFDPVNTDDVNPVFGQTCTAF